MVFLVVLVCSTILPNAASAQNIGASEADRRAFDIGIIIDNRSTAKDDKARAEVDALFEMLDRQMYVEHIMVLERPAISVICGILGCPDNIAGKTPYDPLLFDIAREEQSRILVYYIGDGRIEGVERQLLFPRLERSAANDVVGYPVSWLHATLEVTRPTSAMVMLDASFSPTMLPCAEADRDTVDAALIRARGIYRRVLRSHPPSTENLELSATTAVLPPACDHQDEMQAHPFTRHLLEAVAEGKADDDEDRVIDLGELADFLHQRLDQVAHFEERGQSHVLRLGSGSKSLASVDPRRLQSDNEDVLARRNRSPGEDSFQESVPPSDQEPPAHDGDGEVRTSQNTGGSTLQATQAARCEADPTARDCHACVIDPGGEACIAHCRQNRASTFCADGLTTGPEVDAEETAFTSGGIDVVPINLDETDPGRPDPDERPPGNEPAFGEERSWTCELTADHVAPYLSAIVGRIGDTGSSCGWALDRSEVELGPIGKVFTPVAWRLGRSSVQDAVSCLLDCPSALTTAATEAKGLPVPLVVALETPAPAEQPVRAPETSPLPVALDDRPAVAPTTDANGEVLIDEGSSSAPNPIADLDQADPDPRSDGGSDETVELPKEPPFVATASKVRWLQAALTVDNRDPGPIDGIMGKKTMDAALSWRRDKGDAGRTGKLTEVEFDDIIEAFHERFPHAAERTQPF